MTIARIKLSSLSHKDADSIMGQIKSISETLGVKVDGPIPFPTKVISHTLRKAPSHEGSHTYEKWQMRVHKRMIQLNANDQVLRQIMRIPVPDSVQIEISIS